MRRLCTLLIFLLITCGANATRRHVQPDTRAFTEPLAAQIAQNQLIEQYNLRRIENDQQLREFISSGYLVPMVGSTFAFDPHLPKLRRVALPSTVTFLNLIALEYYSIFGQPLVVTSAIRPLTTQRSLLRHNRNAAPLHGETASSHPTGATIDLSRRSMTRAQTQFMESMLLMYASLGRVIVLEEKHQMCFHVFVIPIKEPTL